MITQDHKVDYQQFYLTVHMQFVQELSPFQLKWSDLEEVALPIPLKWSDLEEVALWPQFDKVSFVSLVTLSTQSGIQDWSHYITYSLKKSHSYIHSSICTFSNDDKLPVSLILLFSSKIFVMSTKKQYEFY